MSKKCQLTVEPLSIGHLYEINPKKIQEGEQYAIAAELEMRMRPHQATFRLNEEIILLTGLIEAAPKVFWSWTIFGEKFEAWHMKYIAKYVKTYYSLLDFDEICHIIDKEKPWTKKMAKVLGFSYKKEFDDTSEWWSIDGNSSPFYHGRDKAP